MELNLGGDLMANTLTTGITGSQQPTPPSSTNNTTNATDNLSNKETFLQLMVAQLKYQNPLNPVDGSTFLAQLSQISSVEQMVEMRKDLDQIRDSLTQASTSTNSTTNS